MILYYFAESFKSLNRAKLGSFITILTTCIAVFFSVVSIILVLLSKDIDEKLKSQIEINLFIEDSLSETEINLLRLSLLDDNSINRVNYISNKEAKEKFVRETGEDFKAVLDVNPLPASFSIRIKPEQVTENLLRNLVERFESIDGINDVVYDYSLTLKILDFIQSMKLFVYIGAIILVILSTYLVYSTNRLLLQTREEQYNTMKLVGARLKTIKIPIILNGIIIGFIASIICMISFNLIIVIISNMYKKINFEESIYYLNIIILFLSLLFGIVGSLLLSQKITLRINQ